MDINFISAPNPSFAVNRSGGGFSTRKLSQMNRQRKLAKLGQKTAKFLKGSDPTNAYIGGGLIAAGWGRKQPTRVGQQAVEGVRNMNPVSELDKSRMVGMAHRFGQTIMEFGRKKQIAKFTKMARSKGVDADGIRMVPDRAFPKKQGWKKKHIKRHRKLTDKVVEQGEYRKAKNTPLHSGELAYNLGRTMMEFGERVESFKRARRPAGGINPRTGLTQEQEIWPLRGALGGAATGAIAGDQITKRTALSKLLPEANERARRRQDLNDAMTGADNWGGKKKRPEIHPNSKNFKALVKTHRKMGRIVGGASGLYIGALGGAIAAAEKKNSAARKRKAAR